VPFDQAGRFSDAVFETDQVSQIPARVPMAVLFACAKAVDNLSTDRCARSMIKRSDKNQSFDILAHWEVVLRLFL
jgi:hypothetical protein